MTQGPSSTVWTARTNRAETRQHTPAPTRPARLPACTDASSKSLLRSALCNAAMKFLNKTQTAISSSVVGAILVAVGYIVDSTTGEYIGELSAIPSMLNWFIVVMGLVPCILGVISLVIMRNYPITPEIAEDMKNKLAASSAHK